MTDAPFIAHMGAVEFLECLDEGSVDAVITDPPYAEVDRHYGRLTELEWRALMDAVVPEVRRVLKPTGSGVFILQPNSERVGRMRPWLFRWIADMCTEWNMVQDAYWWNHVALPSGGANQHGLLRPSVKPCVWLGQPNCYRDQTSVLGEPSDTQRKRMANLDKQSAKSVYSPAGLETNYRRSAEATIRRGGTTPFNCLPFGPRGGPHRASDHGHGAGTPYNLAAWWVRYISPPGGLVVDPFAGTGTKGWAALDQGRRWCGADSDPQWKNEDGLMVPVKPAS